MKRIRMSEGDIFRIEHTIDSPIRPQKISRTLYLLILNTTFGGIEFAGCTGAMILHNPRPGCNQDNYAKINVTEEKMFVELDYIQTLDFQSMGKNATIDFLDEVDDSVLRYIKSEIKNKLNL